MAVRSWYCCSTRLSFRLNSACKFFRGRSSTTTSVLSGTLEAAGDGVEASSGAGDGSACTSGSGSMRSPSPDHGGGPMWGHMTPKRGHDERGDLSRTLRGTQLRGNTMPRAQRGRGRSGPHFCRTVEPATWLQLGGGFDDAASLEHAHFDGFLLAADADVAIGPLGHGTVGLHGLHVLTVFHRCKVLQLRFTHAGLGPLACPFAGQLCSEKSTLAFGLRRHGGIPLVFLQNCNCDKELDTFLLGIPLLVLPNTVLPRPMYRSVFVLYSHHLRHGQLLKTLFHARYNTRKHIPHKRQTRGLLLHGATSACRQVFPPEV